jgi:hypothetical protein
MSDHEPESPECPSDPESEAFMRTHFKACTVDAFESLRGDMPAPLARWFDAWKRWQVEREEWRKEQPLDIKHHSLEYRMFGGPWLPMPHCSTWSGHELHKDGTRTAYVYETPPVLIPKLEAEGVPREELRALAAHIYKHEGMRERIGSDLVKHIRRLHKSTEAKR